LSNTAPLTWCIRDHGATGDGVRLETAAIQAAIDACSAAGGGTVLVPPGVYLTGTLWLRSDVTLHLAAAATLLGSTDPGDYATGIAGCCFVNESALDKCLLYAQDARRIAITGQGTIDGQGGSFPARTPDGRLGDRPMLLRFARCRDIMLRDVTLRSAASWCANFLSCAGLRVQGVTIHNRVNHNNDGIDLTNTRNVLISDCTLICEDDAICFQSMSDDEPVQDIVITNCILSTRWAAIRSGGAHRGGIRNVAVSNCLIYDTYGCGIKLQISGNATMQDMVFSNIVMRGVTSPISLRFGNCHYNNEPGRDERYPWGGMRNILFSNIRATVVDEATLRAAGHEVYEGEQRQCISVCGIPGHPVENVALRGLHITFPGGGTPGDAANLCPPELADLYPEYFMWGVLPAYGLYARHARGLSLEGARFELASADARPAVVCDDVEDLQISGLRADGCAEAPALIRLRGVREAAVSGCSAPGDVPALVRLEGETRGAWLSGNRLTRPSGGATPLVLWECAEGAPEPELPAP
jgi:hypothetical protein